MIKITLNSTQDGVSYQSLDKNFTFYINDRPKNGSLKSISEIGLSNKTYFIFTCKDWHDDKTDISNLRYKMVYNDFNLNKTLNSNSSKLNLDFSTNTTVNVIPSNEQIDIINNMTLLKDWDKNKEALFVFNTFKDEEKIDVYCLVKDEFDIINIKSTSIKIIGERNVKYSHYDELITDILSNIDLSYNVNTTLSDVYKRSFILRSLTDNILNSKVQNLESVNRTSVTVNNQFLKVADVKCNKDLCNNRGLCILRDTFISCFCDIGYYGPNCQISSKLYPKVKNMYNKLIDNLLKTITQGPANEAFISIYNLAISASSFLDWKDRKLIIDNIPELFYTCTRLYSKDEMIEYFKLFMSSVDHSYNFGIEKMLPFKDFTNYDTFENEEFERNIIPGIEEELFGKPISLNDNLKLESRSNINSRRHMNETTLINSTESNVTNNNNNTISNDASENNNVRSQSGARNDFLNPVLKEEFKEYFESIVKEINKIIKFYVSTISEENVNLQYRSLFDIAVADEMANKGIIKKKNSNLVYDNIILNIAYHGRYYNYKKSLEGFKDKYIPYYEMDDCLKNYINNILKPKELNLAIVQITYKSSPFLYEEKLYTNYTSMLTGIEVVDIKSNEILNIKDCSLYSTNSTSNSSISGSDQIKIYFPVDNYYIPRFINNWKELVEPSKQKSKDDDVFTNPIYITDSGVISNKTVSDRINSFYVPLNFSCKYLNEETKEFFNEGMKYKNFTEEGYFECQSNHLTYFNVEYYLNPKSFKLDSRFFYLSKFQILKNIQNYIYNFAFYLFITMISIFVIHVIINIIKNTCFENEDSICSKLKEEIVKVNLPYHLDYNFSSYSEFDNVNIHPKSALEIINKKRTPYLNNLKHIKSLRDIHPDLIGNNNIKDASIDCAKSNVIKVKISNNENINLSSDFKSNSSSNSKISSIFNSNSLILSENRNHSNFENNNNSFDSKNKNIDNLENPKVGYNNHINNDEEINNNIFVDNFEMNDELDSYNKDYKLNNNDEVNKIQNNFIYTRSNPLRKGSTLKMIDEKISSQNNDDDGVIVEYNKENSENNYPKLSNSCSFEKRLMELAHSKLTMCHFLCRNLYNRHILINGLRFTFSYGKFVKLGNLITFFSIIACMNTIFLILKEEFLSSSVSLILF